MNKVDDFKVVNKPIRKKDAMALVTGQPVYTDDIAPKNCLLIKILRSPYAHAMIEDINTDIAMKVPGIEVIYTYKDVPNKRYTTAGQTFPEPSPYDRLILDKELRFVGDPVAIVAGDTEEAIDKAMKVIKVKYKKLPAVLDFHIAKDNEILVHPEDNWKSLADVGADNKRNLVASHKDGYGDVEKVYETCDYVLKHSYRVPACNQTPMETFRTFAQIDPYGRLHVTSSTQIVFHCRRIIANALDIPKSKVRITKPRIGGGFGAKQSVVSEIFPAFVTWMTKKPSKIIYSRYESQIAASPRHEMEVTVTLGAMKDGTIRGISMYTLSNSGAYSEHGPTTVGLTGTKAITLYTGNLEAYKFDYDVVYTNVQAAGAYRGYGATQGIFAVESIVNEFADKIGMDAVEIRLKNMVRQGQIMHSYYGETATSCNLDKCMLKAKKIFDWDNKCKVRDLGSGKVRTAGVAMALQGSGISSVDVGSCTIMLEDEGYYAMSIAAADMGTGCDTILAQMAAECLECDIDDIIVYGVDSDMSPYDSGSYASSTTYVTGKAVEKACMELKDNMLKIASDMLNTSMDKLEFDGKTIRRLESIEGEKNEVTLMEIGTKSMCGNTDSVKITASHSSPVSPPPFMVGMVELELDKETGETKVINYVAVVDCGTTINPNLARVQTEGGLAQGIGMALFENVTYNDGKILENSLMQYKIPTRLDIGTLRVDFASSYEQSGPFGAKSIGEIVINTPAPAIASAIYNATGVWHRSLPITPEKIVMEK